MNLSELARSILEDRAIVHIALLDGKGRPHATPVWVGVDADGRPWINTIVGRLKERQLPLGAPVSLSATAPNNPYIWISVRGLVVERRLEGAEGEIDQLAEKYRGAGAKAKMLPGEQRITIVIDPEAVLGGPTR